MNLSAPKTSTFIVAVIIALLALLGMFVTIPVVSGAAIWVALLAFAVLAAGCMLKGL